MDGGAVTYLARRPMDRRAHGRAKLWEFGVIGHGLDIDQLVAQVADAIRTWDRNFRGREATFEIQPLDAAPTEHRPGLFTLETPLNRITVDWY